MCSDLMHWMCRQRRLQYFWEAFPAQDGLTTYMFAYADPKPGDGSATELAPLPLCLFLTAKHRA